MFVEAIKLKKFIDRSADYQGFCHRWNDNPLYAWQSAGFFYEINILRSTESLPIIGSSTSDRQTVDRWRFIKGSSAVTGYWPSFGQWSPDCQQIMGLVALYCLWYTYPQLQYISKHVLLLFGITFQWTLVTNIIIMFLYQTMTPLNERKVLV